MSTQSAASYSHHVDDDPTRMDLQPWHEESGVHEVEEPTEIFRSSPPAPLRALARPSSGVPFGPSAAFGGPQRLHEPIEALSMPPGLSESMLPAGARPGDRHQMRIAMVRLARELGRDYLRWYGRSLATNVESIERIQRHLLGYANEVLAGRMDTRRLAPELVRHGVLLGEILARVLGAEWLDLSGDQPASWQMIVPPSRVVSPVARVHQFLIERNRGEDLVEFFLGLAS
jgi:hypothetical protein